MPAVAGHRVVVLGPNYAAGALHAFLFGRHHRDLWVTPVCVPVVDLRRFAGGLQPVRRGGGMQTRSLRLRGADGREYVFRSLDKDPSPTLPPALRRTVVKDLLQDQISATHPSAPLVVASLLEAVGVLHVDPWLVVLPDDSLLGPFRAEFAGMVGWLELRPDEGPDGTPGFADAARIIGSERLLERLEADPAERVDAAAYLAARLMDLFLGDWDRHADQWRWAARPQGTAEWWVPIPRDRDQAFVRYDGVLLWLARFHMPQFVSFGPDYPDVVGLTWNARDLDRRLLGGLEATVWDSVAAALRARLTDSVVTAAVARMPPEHQERQADFLASALRRRRDALPAMARRFYALLARTVELHATDVPEVLRVRALSTDTLLVTVTACPDCVPYWTRRLRAGETREIRVYLRGGDDDVRIDGSVRGITVRVVGGGGDDTFRDATAGRGVRLYDDRGDNDVASEGGTLDARPFDAATARSWPPSALRDWGARSVPLPWFTAGPDVGVLVGGGIKHTRYGFRNVPYGRQWILRGGYAFGAARARVEAIGDYRRENSSTAITIMARWSGIDLLHFHGFGNETPGDGPRDAFRVRQQRVAVGAAWSAAPVPRIRVSAGPDLRYSTTDPAPGSVADRERPYGVEPFGQAGLQAQVVGDWRDHPVAPTAGTRVVLRGRVYPAVWDVVDPFAVLQAVGSIYLTAPVAARPTLAVRAGAERVVGRFPFHEAATVGGSETLRGVTAQRFAGRTSAYGGADLRLRLGEVLVVLPAAVGLLGLVDVARVWADGETSGRWHRSVGGGVWLAVLDPGGTVSAFVAQSDVGTGLYAGAGFGF